MGRHSCTLERALRAGAILVWIGIIIFAALHRREFTLDAVLSYTPDNLLLAFFVLMALFLLKSLTVVFYAGLLYTAGGVLFPLPLALLVNLCGTLLMAALPYLLARSVGAVPADELREKYPKLKRFESVRSRNPFAFVLVLRCINLVNFDVGSMYCGAVRTAPATFLAASALGKAADIVTWSIMGANLERRDPIPFFIALAVDLSIALVVVLWAKQQAKKADGSV